MSFGGRFEDLHVQGQRVGLATVYRSQLRASRTTVASTLLSDGRSPITPLVHDTITVITWRMPGAVYRGDRAVADQSWVDSVAAAHGFGDVEHSLGCFKLCAHPASQ